LTETNDELKNGIHQFYEILNKYPDEIKYTHDYVFFLKSFLKIQCQSLPLTELMTLIKHKKPNIFSGIRRLSDKNIMLNILSELSTDIESAQNSLEKIIGSE